MRGKYNLLCMFLDVAKKIRDAAISAMPVLVVVTVLFILQKCNVSVISISDNSYWLFLICSVILVGGMFLFTAGADTAMAKMGEYVGSSLTKKQSVGLLVLILCLFGIFVTVAEPDLNVFAAQVFPNADQAAVKWLLIISISVGVGAFLVVGACRILFQKDLKLWLIAFYGLLFAVACLVDYSYIPLSFDSGGVTTGPITVPFVLALGVGIATSRGGKSNSDSFGLVAFASIGPILMVMIFSLFLRDKASYIYTGASEINDLFSPIGHALLRSLGNVALSVGPIVLFFVVYNFMFLKLPYSVLLKIGLGVLATYFGLVLFLTAVDAGFMPIGAMMGESIASNSGLLVGIGVILGVAAVFAEPAVHVLTDQIEVASDGAIKKTSVLLSLAFGNGLAIGLSLFRMLTGFSLLYILVPGYILAFTLTFFVPNIYSAIAFDSGGVVSGPMNSAFILPFAIGACFTFYGGSENIMTHAFGTIAIVAMMPLISIQLLGFSASIKLVMNYRLARKRVREEFDDQIIHFN